MAYHHDALSMVSFGPVLRMREGRMTVKLFRAPALVFALLMSVSVPSCPNAREGTMSQREQEVARIAGQYVAAHIPDFDTVKYPPIVLDHGNIYEVAYQLPENALGGTPHVIILKSPLTVSGAFRQQ